MVTGAQLDPRRELCLPLQNTYTICRTWAIQTQESQNLLTSM